MATQSVAELLVDSLIRAVKDAETPGPGFQLHLDQLRDQAKGALLLELDRLQNESEVRREALATSNRLLQEAREVVASIDRLVGTRMPIDYTAPGYPEQVHGRVSRFVRSTHDHSLEVKRLAEDILRMLKARAELG